VTTEANTANAVKRSMSLIALLTQVDLKSPVQKRYFLVIDPLRSGTTLLAAML